MVLGRSLWFLAVLGGIGSYLWFLVVLDSSWWFLVLQGVIVHRLVFSNRLVGVYVLGVSWFWYGYP